MPRRFQQVDVFTSVAYLGNPVAVVLDGEGLDDDQLARFSSWTNLSETTFVLPPTTDAADYRVRIFSLERELPFAGHPTLGTCHAWLEAGGVPRDAEQIVQECGAGLVRVRRTPEGLAFAAPPLVRSGAVDEPLVERIAGLLRIDRGEIVDSQWVDNGPGWVAVLLRDAEAVLALEPGYVDIDLGVVGPYPDGSDAAFEVRAFFPKSGATAEDPVTGSLNASLAGWLLASGRATSPYVVEPGHGARPAGSRPHHRGRRRDDLGRRWHGHVHPRRGRALAVAVNGNAPPAGVPDHGYGRDANSGVSRACSSVSPRMSSSSRPIGSSTLRARSSATPMPISSVIVRTESMTEVSLPRPIGAYAEMGDRRPVCGKSNCCLGTHPVRGCGRGDGTG